MQIAKQMKMNRFQQSSILTIEGLLEVGEERVGRSTSRPCSRGKQLLAAAAQGGVLCPVLRAAPWPKALHPPLSSSQMHLFSATDVPGHRSSVHTPDLPWDHSYSNTFKLKSPPCIYYYRFFFNMFFLR